MMVETGNMVLILCPTWSPKSRTMAVRHGRFVPANGGGKLHDPDPKGPEFSSGIDFKAKAFIKDSFYRMK